MSPRLGLVLPLVACLLTACGGSKVIEKPEPLEAGKYASRHRLGVEDLLSAIGEQRDPLSSMYEARAAVEMIAAVFESQRQGGPVPLPLATRENPLALMKSEE